MAHETPGRTTEPRDGWAAPHLLAGRGRAALIATAALIAAGALTDTLAFRNTLELVLPHDSGSVALLMAVGATSMALVAAASLGIAMAIRRRGGHAASRLSMTCTAIVWLSLGLAMFLVRWLDTAASAGTTTYGGSSAGRHTPLVAAFFAAIYLISGACTMFELERLYNPEHFAHVRLAKQYRVQAARAAVARATLHRARAAVDHHAGELDREDHRRLAAIAERQALGAEAANYARVLMAGMLADPAKTPLTETGPTPHMPSRSSRPAGSADQDYGAA